MTLLITGSGKSTITPNRLMANPPLSGHYVVT